MPSVSTEPLHSPHQSCDLLIGHVARGHVPSKTITGERLRQSPTSPFIPSQYRHLLQYWPVKLAMVSVIAFSRTLVPALVFLHYLRALVGDGSANVYLATSSSLARSLHHMSCICSMVSLDGGSQGGNPAATHSKIVAVAQRTITPPITTGVGITPSRTNLANVSPSVWSTLFIIITSVCSSSNPVGFIAFSRASSRGNPCIMPGGWLVSKTTDHSPLLPLFCGLLPLPLLSSRSIGA